MVRDDAPEFRLHQCKKRPVSTPGLFGMTRCKSQAFSASSWNKVSTGTLKVAASFNVSRTDASWS